MSTHFDYDVFLSHSSKDKPVVRELANRLKQDGLCVWLDEWEIQPGDMMRLKSSQGLELSRMLPWRDLWSCPPLISRLKNLLCGSPIIELMNFNLREK